MKNMKSFLEILKGTICRPYVIIFILLLAFTIILGGFYIYGLHPTKKKVNNLIKKFTVNQYSISYYVAERYLSWLHMRTFFYMLNYSLTLVGIIANLLTIYYASQSSGRSDDITIFFSLLSTYFTIGNLFIHPCSLSNMSQHVWRELDTCIVKTLYMDHLSPNEKSIIINDKIDELEKYIETFEH